MIWNSLEAPYQRNNKEKKVRQDRRETKEEVETW